MFQYYYSMEQDRPGNESAANLLPPWNFSLIHKMYLAAAFEFSFSFLDGCVGGEIYISDIIYIYRQPIF